MPSQIAGLMRSSPHGFHVTRSDNSPRTPVMAHAKPAEGEHRGRSPTAHEPGDRQKQKINLRVNTIIRINQAPPHDRRRVREHDEPPERAPGLADVAMPKS